MTTPPPIPSPRRGKDDRKDNLSTIVFSIIGVGIILALAIAIGVPAYFKHLKQQRIAKENEQYREEMSQMRISDLKEGREFYVRDAAQSAGDSYMFQLEEGDFAPVPQGATWMKPFIYRIDNMAPDSNGKVSVIACDRLRTLLPIDSLVFSSSDKPFAPITLHFADDPAKTVVLTYINADIYNHCEKDSISYHSYVAFVKGFLFDSGTAGENNKIMPGSGVERDHDNQLYTFTLHEDDFAPVIKGATGVKQFVCSVDNRVPDKAGKVFVGTANARAWLNIDSMVNKTTGKAFRPVTLKIKGSNDVVSLTEISVTTRLHSDKKNNEYKSYNATIHGYVFTTDSIISQ